MFKEEEFSCPKKSNSRARRRAVLVFEEEQFPSSKKSIRRVRRRAFIVFEEKQFVRPKKFQTAEKSRGELRFGRKFVRNDRSDENYHLKTFSEPSGFKQHVFENFFAGVSKSFLRCPFPLPFIQCNKMHGATYDCFNFVSITAM